METVGFREKSLLEKLVERSKAFDDLTSIHAYFQATFSVKEAKLRDELIVARAARRQLRAQLNWSTEELAKAAWIVKEQETLVSFQTTRIEDLERRHSAG